MATVTSALRTVITDAALSNVTTKVFRDVAPDSTAMPYVTFDDDLARSPALFGDNAVRARSRMVQIDLWQNLDGEDVTLIDSLLAAVDSADLTGADKTIFGCRVVDIQRFIEPSSNLCRHSLTAMITQAH